MTRRQTARVRSFTAPPRTEGMRCAPFAFSLFALVAALASAACTEPAHDQAPEHAWPPTTTVVPEVKSASEAKAIARACAASTPKVFATVWGTAPLFERATASTSGDGDWLVSVPESGLDDEGRPHVLGAPRGVDIVVRRWSRDCVRAPMD